MRPGQVRLSCGVCLPPATPPELEAAAGLASEQEVAPPSVSDRSQLGRRAARGALVTVGAQGIKIVLQVVGVVVLARLLTPGTTGSWRW